MAITFGGSQTYNTPYIPAPQSRGITVPWAQPDPVVITPEQQNQLEYEKQREEQQRKANAPVIPGFVGQSPVTQPAYEMQALEALRQQGDRGTQERDITGRQSLAQFQATQAADLARQQAAAEAALQAASFSGQKGLLDANFTGQRGLLDRRAELSEDAFRNRFSMLQGAGTGAGAQVQHGAGPQGNEMAARAAAFARAKEQAGQTANASLAALRGLYEGRGTMGSTMEAADAGRVIGGAGAGVNAFTREQLLSDLARAAEIEDMQYQGNITQRGQDINARNALYSLMNAGTLY